MDLRVPSGSFFLLLGGILIAMAIADPGARAPLTDINANLYAGTVMILFGGALLWLAKQRS